MKKIFIVAFLLLTACAPLPVPTRVLPTPMPTPLPTATLPTQPPTPPTPSPTETLAPKLVPTPQIIPTATTISTVTVTYDRNPRAILIEADVSSPLPRDAHVPVFRLYADGFVVFAGERASLTSGLDATVRMGRLSDSQVQSLLTTLNQLGFFGLNDYYEPRPKPSDATTASINVYLNRAKTVRVYAPDSDTTPRSFANAFDAIKKSIPSDAQTFTPVEGYLDSTPAGSINDVANVNVTEWKDATIHLADFQDGVNVSGAAFTSVATNVSKAYPSTLFREGDRVYRVRFAPTLPRGVFLTDWIGSILNAPREFDGRVFEVTGFFRGWNLYGEARGNPPVTKNDWVIADATGAMYVTGAPPRGLDSSARTDAWTLIRLRGVVNYVRLGTSHFEVRRVDILPSSAAIPTPAPTSATTPTLIALQATPAGTPTPSLTPTVTATRAPTRTPIVINTQDAAVAAIKKNYPEVANINSKGAGVIGATTDIKVVARQDPWQLVFWEGWGDCPSGCINQRYHYFTVERNGRVSKIAEYSRIFIAEKNAYEEKGSPLWGVP